MEQLYRLLQKRVAEDKDTVLCTIVAGTGSAPRGAGAQMLVGPEGILAGTVGGGAVEWNAVQLCGELLAEKHDARRSFALHPDEKDDIGMVCGGDVTLDFRFIAGTDPLWKGLLGKLTERMAAGRESILVLGEPCGLLDESNRPLTGQSGVQTGFMVRLTPRERAVVFGGGHVSMELVPLLEHLHFAVTVVDDRPEFAIRERFPAAEQVLCGDYGETVPKLKLCDRDYVVVMTNGHAHDYEVEHRVLQGEKVAYLGVIGSHKKTAVVNETLLRAGIPQEKIDFVCAPIGTQIGAETPAEIAVSIAGEMILRRAELRSERAHACPMHALGS